MQRRSLKMSTHSRAGNAEEARVAKRRADSEARSHTLQEQLSLSRCFPTGMDGVPVEVGIHPAALMTCATLRLDTAWLWVDRRGGEMIDLIAVSFGLEVE